MILFPVILAVTFAFGTSELLASSIPCIENAVADAPSSLNVIVLLVILFVNVPKGAATTKSIAIPRIVVLAVTTAEVILLFDILADL